MITRFLILLAVLVDCHSGTLIIGRPVTSSGVGGGGVTAQSPTDIGSVELWLDSTVSASMVDATSGGSTVANGATIARWEDQSGNGRHVTQSTSGNRPTRQDAAQNGQTAVRFDGTDDYLFSTTATALSRNVTGYTIVVVAKSTTTNANRTAISYSTATTTEIRGRVRFGSSGSYEGTGRRLDGGAAAGQNGVASIGASTWHVIVYSVNCATDRADLYIDGTLDGSNTTWNTGTTGQSTSNTNSGRRQVGSGIDSAQFWSGDIGAIVVYGKALSSTEAANNTEYFRQLFATP